MKNCPHGDGEVVTRQHCNASGCTWWVCETHSIVFDANNITKIMTWNGRR